MEIREFAERVLFGRTLAEKLAVPGPLDDRVRGPAGLGVVVPNRPAGLALASANAKKVAFPKLSDLDAEEARGQVLHFFANHELLALELMALALLRFPDAPTSFRRGLVGTMADEQRHLTLYLQRMKDLGVSLGAVPMNAFFWDHLSPVATPLEFVAGMSLTFEQANLDFSLHYRDAFREVGDEVTAEIMEQVLVDEVAHVRHGVRCFEQWRDPSHSQWQAYTEALSFPLTPARAKGLGFTASHRADAGLDTDFIARLRVYSHSKGRPPRVLLFNPGTEAALAHGDRGYTPPRGIQALARDLELLPMFLMGRDDVLLVRTEPQPAHLSRLMELGYPIPELVPVDRDARRIPDPALLGDRPIAALAPWGWDPSAAEFLQPLASAIPGGPSDLQSVVETRRPLASKAWLAEQIPALLSALPEDWRAGCVTASLPTVARELEAVRAQLEQHRGAGTRYVVVKAPLGTAGRAALRVDREGPEPKQQRWIEDVLSSQGAVVIEPWLERVLDLSYLFKVQPDGELTEIGFSRFFTDGTGRYRGAALGPVGAALADDLRPFVYQGAEDPEWLWKATRVVARGLLPGLRAAGFSGLAGLDLMIVKEPNGEPKLRLPLELNPRATMGHVALALSRPLGTWATGVWLLLTQADLSATGCADFASLCSRIDDRLPTRTEGAPPRLRQGSFATNDPTTAGGVLSLVVVAQRLDEVRGVLADVGLADPMVSRVLAD